MSDRKRILVFGNLLVDKDNTPLKLIPILKEKFSNIEFIEIDPTDELQNYGKDLLIIDTIERIDRVIELNIKSEKDFEKLNAEKIYTMHDFDLGYNLKLLKKMNLIDSAKIIGVPMNSDLEKSLNHIQLILRKWVAQLMQGS